MLSKIELLGLGSAGLVPLSVQFSLFGGCLGRVDHGGEDSSEMTTYRALFLGGWFLPGTLGLSISPRQRKLNKRNYNSLCVDRRYPLMSSTNSAKRRGKFSRRSDLNSNPLVCQKSNPHRARRPTQRFTQWPISSKS
uniref:Uncharacterized protein n=1 Tax=Solanum tuberosum TaxID=4113 RepID=M1D959_SOLTU